MSSLRTDLFSVPVVLPKIEILEMLLPILWEQHQKRINEQLHFWVTHMSILLQINFLKSVKLSNSSVDIQCN